MLCWEDINTASGLVKATLEYMFDCAYKSLAKNNITLSQKPKPEKVTILLPAGDKKSEVAAILRGFCRKYGLIPVPIYKLVDCLKEDVPKVIIAYDFSQKHWTFFPHGFTPISLKELASRGVIGSNVTFTDIKTIARVIFSEKIKVGKKQ